MRGDVEEGDKSSTMGCREAVRKKSALRDARALVASKQVFLKAPVRAAEAHSYRRSSSSSSSSSSLDGRTLLFEDPSSIALVPARRTSRLVSRPISLVPLLHRSCIPLFRSCLRVFLSFFCYRNISTFCSTLPWWPFLYPVTRHSLRRNGTRKVKRFCDEVLLTLE